MKSKTLDNNTYASDPGEIRLSHEKLRTFHPELYKPRGLFRLLKRLSPLQKYWLLRLEEHLIYGDSRAAIVASVAPLIVAAYTDELDCIALLRFPEPLVQQYQLKPGTRLLTVNTYTAGTKPVADLENGPASYHRYRNFQPVIADFLSDDAARIATRKAEIPEAEWERTYKLAQALSARKKLFVRDGRPKNSGNVGAPIKRKV